MKSDIVNDKIPKDLKLETVEDFQNLIDSRGYRKPLDFMIDFGTGYKRLTQLGFTKKVKYPQDTKYQEYSGKTIEEIQEMIDNCEEPIVSLQKLGSLTSMFLVTYIKDMGWENKLKFKEIKNSGDYSFITTLDDFQNFINLNGYSSPADFKTHKPYLYKKMLKAGFCNKVYYTTKYGNKAYSKDTFKYGDYFGLTLGQVQEIINENELFSLSQLGRYFSHKLWRYIVDYNFESKLSFISPKGTHDYHTWKRFPEVNTFEKIQEFIYEKKISSRGYFHNLYSIVYNRAKKLGCLDKLKYTNELSEALVAGFSSSWEQNLFMFLKKSLKDYEKEIEISHNVFIPDCVDIKSLEIDIEIYLKTKDFYIEIEVQGPTHFYSCVEGSNIEYTRKHDIMKNNWVNSCHNRKILYFCYDSSLIEKYSYPYNIITEEECLLSEILKIITQ